MDPSTSLRMTVERKTQEEQSAPYRYSPMRPRCLLRRPRFVILSVVEGSASTSPLYAHCLLHQSRRGNTRKPFVSVLPFPLLPLDPSASLRMTVERKTHEEQSALPATALYSPTASSDKCVPTTDHRPPTTPARHPERSQRKRPAFRLQEVKGRSSSVSHGFDDAVGVDGGDAISSSAFGDVEGVVDAFGEAAVILIEAGGGDAEAGGHGEAAREGRGPV